MSDDEHRPDPDALLRQVKAEEEKVARARLKIFFGFAPGVGKTYRMLQVARDLLEQKVDVMIGVVETHGRSDTAELAEGLPRIPKKKLEYQGRLLEEFDLDAALERRPKILLLDELAHTNIPGSRHAKRYQDVQELLEAGIDVLTTLNVQHVESLNDVVAQITHVQVRETVPDSVLERADEVELVDISPEELLNRLKEGKVYLAEQAARAVEHFFKPGNLLALRELALRRTAERVDAQVLAYRALHGVETTWPTTERVLVCVSSSPASSRLIRAGYRIASALRAPWIGVYVEAFGLAPMSEGDRRSLEENLRLVEALGGQIVRLTSVRTSDAILSYARKNNVTRIIIGKPTHPRIKDRILGSLLDEVVRGSEAIDVHVISGDRPGDPPRAPQEQEESSSLTRYLWAGLVVGLTTILAFGLERGLHVPDVEMLYLLGVSISAALYGRGPSVLAAALSVAAYDFFFVAPFYTLAVADSQHFMTFAMMFLVGILVSSLTTRLRQQGAQAREREERTAALYTVSRELGSVIDVAGVAEVTARNVSEIAGAPAIVYVTGAAGLDLGAAWPAQTRLDASDMAVARWVAEHGRVAGRATDTLPGSKAVCFPLQIEARPVGVLAVLSEAEQWIGADQRAFLESLGRLSAFALERVRFAEQARQAALRAKTEEMRSSLLSSVSHDLRTPLASITGAATSLRDDSLSPGDARDLTESICEEAERLERLVGNLLDMTRLDSGSVQPKREWVPVEEVVGSALTRLEKVLVGRAVSAKLPSDLPLLFIDPVLIEQLLTNLLDNASRYSPPGSPIEVEASAEQGGVALEVRDRGPGLERGEEERIFDRFYRGKQAQAAVGAGLGLPICRAIAFVHGGTLVASARPGGGAIFRLSLPKPDEEPPRSEEPKNGASA
ncbi:MAG: sensor histidine kinase KdpD [Myxococcota bacterium]